MELTPYKLVWAVQILILWVPWVLAGCSQDLNTLGFQRSQKLVQTYQEMSNGCQTLINGQSEECSTDCDGHVQKMVELYEGRAIFFTCDCTDPTPVYPEDVCLKVQERVVVCPTLRAILSPATTPSSTTPTILVDGMIPCVKARRRCVTDGNCRSQLEATISACGGPGCGEECQSSLDALLAQRQAQGMWGCTGCGEGDDEDSWCDLSRRCTDAQEQGTVVPYKPGGTAKTSDNEGKGGTARKSVKESPGNAAGPTCAVCVSSAGLYAIGSVILRIAFV